MKTIAVINQKGGVGKTTTTVNLGAGLARFGKRVLVLDLDPQANLTLHIDRRPELETGTVTQLFVEDRPMRELIQPGDEDGMWVIPADTSLGGVEQVLANRIGREILLREALDAYDGEPFDYVLFDCPPSLGVLSANALVAADEVLIPMQTEYFSLQGMAKLTEVIQLVQRRLNPSLEILCVLPCMVDLRTRLTAEVYAEIERHFGELVARTPIRSNVKLAEAPSFGRSIFAHAPDSNGAADYEALAAEVLTRHGAAPAADAFRHDDPDAEATDEATDEAASAADPEPAGIEPPPAPDPIEIPEAAADVPAIPAVESPDEPVPPVPSAPEPPPVPVRPTEFGAGPENQLDAAE